MDSWWINWNKICGGFILHFQSIYTDIGAQLVITVAVYLIGVYFMYAYLL